MNVVLFTGSYEVGKRIQQLSAEQYDRIVAAEMGSKSAVIVCEDARHGSCRGSGSHQRLQNERSALCVGRGILVAEKRADEFAEKFVATARRLKIGNPLETANFTGPVINQAAVEKVLRYNVLAREEGAHPS